MPWSIKIRMAACGLAGLLPLGVAAQSSWRTPAPPGGTVRALAAEPGHPTDLLLGTTNGLVYASIDSGGHWTLRGRVGEHDDWVVAALDPDPTRPGHWYAALWSWSGDGGGVYESNDSGATWQARLEGHSVRGLALAPSDPKVLAVAAIDGVYRSRDAGLHWDRISPANDRELMNVESVAIDPQQPDSIYVGTWHLPWKTINGGHDWWQMRNGVIDDSDVFSILIDHTRPDTVYLSACSGIYESDNRGNLFRKIDGIPFTARRTPALVQDTADPRTIYAGTTQGLWLSRDAGATWRLVTPSTLSVNSVLMLPGGRVVLGTEYAGVMAAAAGELKFTASNTGFSNRRVVAVADAPGHRFMAVSGDQAWGGVFVTSDQGETWEAIGVPPREPTSLAWSPSGLLAGTDRGLYRWAPASGASTAKWLAVGGKAGLGKIAALAISTGEPETFFAAGERGLWASQDGGTTWALRPAAPAPLAGLLSLPEGRMLIVGEGYILRSSDLGKHVLGPRFDIQGRVRQLTWGLLPSESGSHPVAFLATTAGLFQSWDGGQNWSLSGHGLPQQEIRTVNFWGGGVFVTGVNPGQAFSSSDGVRWRPASLPLEQEAWARLGPFGLGEIHASTAPHLARADH